MFNEQRIVYNNNNVNRNLKSWYAILLNVLNNLELEYILHDFNKNVHYLPCISKRLRDQYVHQWKDTMPIQPKLYCYRMFKRLSVISYELYLDNITNDKRRKTFTQFRLSSHCLFIETNRYNGTPRNERKCVLCTQNVCESEYHFLLCCPLYKELRTKYNINYSWPNLNMFTNIMSNYTASSVNDISNFLREAFTLRENQINIVAAS